MSRFLFILLLGLGVLYGATSVDEKISNTSKAIKNFDSNYASINTKMASTAKAILKKERTVLTQQKKIQNLEADLDAKAGQLKQSRSALEETTLAQEKLAADQQQLEQELSAMLARIVSLAMIHKDSNTLSPDAIIGEEVFKALNAKAAETLKELERTYAANKKVLSELTQKTASIQNDITAIEKKKRTLETAKKKNEAALHQLRKKKRAYRGELKKLLAQKDALKQTLSRLNIIKESKEQAASARAEKQRNEALLASKTLPEVRSVGSSYHRARTRRYRGPRTIAPLDRYTITKRYGTYTDPIYHIKVFNESITLKPKDADAKVKSVFNGKVILAQDTPLLENVVIIEHSNGLHTIYAHLDQIAPTVKKGKWLKKGSIIGRVNDELMFEVTQKNDHINPIRLFQ